MRYDGHRVRVLRDDASENLARPKPSNPGGQHVRVLTDQRDGIIVNLADYTLDLRELLEQASTYVIASLWTSERDELLARIDKALG